MRVDYAERARALVGTPFRLQGRGEGGLDCVGVAMATYGIPAGSVRRDYRLRGNDPGEALAFLDGQFGRIDGANLGLGDLMLIRVAEDQLHFAIRTEAGFVHAHAGLRRVVETPGAPGWPILAVYRKKRD